MTARRPAARWRWTPPAMRFRRELVRGSDELARAWETEDHQWFWRTPTDSGSAPLRIDAERAAKHAVKLADIRRTEGSK